MMKGFKILFFTGLLSVLFSINVNAQKIYQVSNIEDADVTVFVVTDSLQADLRVFEVEVFEDANRDGLWFGTIDIENAMIKIYITQDPTIANISVIYTEEEDEAGWLKTDNRHLYKGDI